MKLESKLPFSCHSVCSWWPQAIFLLLSLLPGITQVLTGRTPWASTEWHSLQGLRYKIRGFTIYVINWSEPMTNHTCRAGSFPNLWKQIISCSPKVRSVEYGVGESSEQWRSTQRWVAGFTEPSLLGILASHSSRGILEREPAGGLPARGQQLPGLRFSSGEGVLLPDRFVVPNLVIWGSHFTS